MKKVMKFVKGKKEEEKEIPVVVKAAPLDVRSQSFDKSDESLKDDDFIYKDKSVTKLHKAVWNENGDKLVTIIKTHDIDITDRLDRTALYFAVLKNNPIIVNLLLENSANQNIPDIDGVTPFLKSVQLGYRECAAILLNYGADLKKTDKDVNTPLHFAVMANDIDMLSFLLEHNADCNISNANGDFPLHIAIKEENIQMIELLLNHKSDLNAVNSNGLTATMLAEQKANPEITSLLENYNYSIKNLYLAPDDNSVTASSSHKSSYENLKNDNQYYVKDTWNDSPVSTPVKKGKEKCGKMKRYLKDENEIVEEKSESDVSVKCSENTSPQSGIIPPPCKPLRSLEYLQSGMTIDNRPVHLLTLGTVRTRHISMTESDHSKNNTPQRYSYQGDYQLTPTSESHPKHNDDKDNIKTKLLNKIECDSTVQSDWDSNESLPLDEISRKDKSIGSGTSKNSNSGSIRDKNDSFLQKHFCILEDYEINCDKRCTYEMDLPMRVERNPQLDNTNHVINDRNYRTLDKHTSYNNSRLQRNAKSKSLPRNCEPYSSYHKGSHSLPRTLESGKDPFRDMRNCGNFKPRSHFFSLKMLKGEKKNTFLDKLKSMFNKKSQVYLTDQTESNGTWLYKEKYKVRTDHEFYSAEAAFSASETSSSRRSHHSDFGSDLREMDENQMYRESDIAFCNNEQNKVYEKKILLMNNMSHSRNASTSQIHGRQLEPKLEKCTNETCPIKQQTYCTDLNISIKPKQQNFLSWVKTSTVPSTATTNISSSSLDNCSFALLDDNKPCHECNDFVSYMLTEAEQNISDKEKLITLLQEQLLHLKDRNVKSINEAQDVYYKYGIALQELEAARQSVLKYDEELHRVRQEKCRIMEREQLAQKFKDDADRWKKQYEDLLAKITIKEKVDSDDSMHSLNKPEDDDWKYAIQTEVSSAVKLLTENSQSLISSLEKQNKKLESLVEKLQYELESSHSREQELQRELRAIQSKLVNFGPGNSETSTELKEKCLDTCANIQQKNEQLRHELEHITKLYHELQRDYEENLSMFKDTISNASKISDEYEKIKSESKEIETGVSNIFGEVIKLKENSLIMTNKLRDEAIYIDAPITTKEYINNLTESIQMIECCKLPTDQVEEKLKKILNSLIQLQNVIVANSEMSSRICEIKYCDRSAENLRLKAEIDKQLQQIDELQTQLHEIQNQNCVLSDTLQTNDTLKKKINRSLDEIDKLSQDVKYKEDVLDMQSEKIVHLKSVLQKEQQMNASLSTELKKAKTDLEKEIVTNKTLRLQNIELSDEIKTVLSQIDQEKALNLKLLNDNISTKSKLDSAQKEKTKISQENVALKALVEEIQADNQELHNQLTAQIASLKESQQTIDYYRKELKNLQSLKLSTTENQEIVQTLQQENNCLKIQCQKEKENASSLKKHIDSLQFFHENEMKASFTRLDEIKTQNQHEMEKIQTENNTLKQKVSNLSIENKKLTNVIQNLTENINDLNSPFNDSATTDEESPSTSTDNEKKKVCSKKKSSKTCKYKMKKSHPKEIIQLSVEENENLKEKVSEIEKKFSNLMENNTNSEDTKSTSLPNLEVIKQNKDEFVTCSQGLPRNRKVNSFECVNKNCPNMNLSSNESSPINDPTLTDKWTKQLESLHKLRNELSELLLKLNLRQGKEEDCTSIECIGRFKVVMESLQKQVNELNFRSAEESRKCKGLQCELKGLREQMIAKEQMTNEIEKLRKELYKQKVESVQEIEKDRIKREAEILSIQYKLKEQYLESKLKLLSDLEEIQLVLKEKTQSEQSIKRKCDELVKKVQINQDARKKRVEEIVKYVPTEVVVNPDKLATGLREIFQQANREQINASDTQEPENPQQIINDIRTKLNTEKNRLEPDSVPCSSSTKPDDELKEKYLLN